MHDEEEDAGQLHTYALCQQQSVVQCVAMIGTTECHVISVIIAGQTVAMADNWCLMYIG